jgi:hypothetical protein
VKAIGEKVQRALDDTIGNAEREIESAHAVVKEG